jgi:hypothetical protein
MTRLVVMAQTQHSDDPQASGKPITKIIFVYTFNAATRPAPVKSARRIAASIGKIGENQQVS